MKEMLFKIKYDLYLVLLGVLSFLSYINILDKFLLPLYIAIGLVLIIKKANILYLVPLAIFMQMGFSVLRDNVELTTIYSLVLLGLIILDVVLNRKLKKLGKLFIPLAILSGLSIITHINSPDLFTTFAGFSQIFSVSLLYVYFINTIDAESDNVYKVAKIFMYSAMLVSFEMMYNLSVSELDIITVIRTRTINVGWENLNIIIYSNILSIPLIGYLVMKSRIKLPYMIFALISITGILLTLSRSSILTLGVFVLFLAPYIIYKDKHKLNLLLQSIAFIAIVIGIGFILEEYSIISDYFNSLFGRDLFAYDDRFELLVVSWDKLKEFPIFGSGGLYSSRVHLSDFGALNYHNTFAQASTLGMLGLGAFVYLFVLKTKLIFKKKSDLKWILFVLIYVTAFVNGMLQPMYFYTTYMIFIFIIIAVYENSNDMA